VVVLLQVGVAVSSKPLVRSCECRRLSGRLYIYFSPKGKTARARQHVSQRGVGVFVGFHRFPLGFKSFFKFA